MTTRKVQSKNGRYQITIPKLLVELMDAKPGRMMGFRLEDGKILLSPATTSTASATEMRTLRLHHGVYMATIPKLLAEALKLKPGKTVDLRWHSGEVLITPLTAETMAEEGAARGPGPAASAGSGSVTPPPRVVEDFLEGVRRVWPVGGKLGKELVVPLRRTVADVLMEADVT